MSERSDRFLCAACLCLLCVVHDGVNSVRSECSDDVLPLSERCSFVESLQRVPIGEHRASHRQRRQSRSGRRCIGFDELLLLRRAFAARGRGGGLSLLLLRGEAAAHRCCGVRATASASSREQWSGQRTTRPADKRGAFNDRLPTSHSASSPQHTSTASKRKKWEKTLVSDDRGPRATKRCNNDTATEAYADEQNGHYARAQQLTARSDHFSVKHARRRSAGSLQARENALYVCVTRI